MKNNKTDKNTTNRGVSVYPPTPEQAISAVFKISKADLKKVMGKRPGGKRKK